MLHPISKLFIKNLLYPILKRKPDFLIIGTAKAGTTSLFKYLCNHPQVTCPDRKKEIHYFNNDENYEKGLGWYLSAFPYRFKYSQSKTFEATPHYLYYPKAARRIRCDLGAIKIIVSLREPASRAYSHWKMYHSFANNHQDHLRRLYDNRSFSEAIAEELDTHVPSTLKRYPYVDYGLYATQLKRYFELFGRENIFVFNYKDLFNPIALMDDICVFLRIDHFPDGLASAIFSKKYNRGKKTELSIEDQETLDNLYRYFKPHNENLFKLLGKSFDW